jgi:hypothetical protein
VSHFLCVRRATWGKNKSSERTFLASRRGIEVFVFAVRASDDRIWAKAIDECQGNLTAENTVRNAEDGDFPTPLLPLFIQVAQGDA